MAISESTVKEIFKTYYSEKDVENTFFRNSSLGKEITKSRVGGKEYRFLVLYGRGGAAAGDLTVAAANAASGGSKNVEFVVPYGNFFSVFNIGQQEVLAGRTTKGAYIPAIIDKMAGALDGYRKLFATSLYGTGYGEVGHAVVATTIVGSNTVDFVDKSLVLKLSVGMSFYVTNGATPASTLRTSKNTITKIDGTSVTFTATAIETWAATDWVEIEGSRNGSSPLLPAGLPAWLPAIANRTGATWTSYIGTTWNGVDRSVDTNALAGQFILRDSGNSEKYVDAIMRGIEAVRTAGGEPNMIVVNSLDLGKIYKEIAAQTTYMQQINTTPKKGTNEVAKGISLMSFAFSTSWIEYVWEDPYCPQGTAYILDKDVIEFVCQSEVDKPMNDGIAGNNPGAQKVNQVTAPTTEGAGFYGFIFDDYITINPAANTASGPAAQIILAMYGNFAVRNPAHNCVIVL